MATGAQEQVQTGSIGGRSPLGTALGYLWRVLVCAVAYMIGMAIGGMLAAASGLPMPTMAEGTAEEGTMAQLAVATPVLVISLLPLAMRQAGTFLARWLALGLFTYVSLGLNTAIEAAVFSNMGGASGLILVFVAPTFLCAAAVAWLFAPRHAAEPFAARARAFFGARSVVRWVCRLVLAVLAFPVVYWIFGMLLMAVRPQLMEYYMSGELGLRVPAPQVILGVQILRSSLFLIAALPLLVMWTGTRRGLAAALGLGYAVTVGAFHLLQSSFMPLEMRLGHGIEIALDSFAYALALVWLLVPRREGETQSEGTSQ
jgi:hypothetical protein